MLCETGLNTETLENMCETFVLRPETLYAASNQQYAQCCDASFVNQSVAICGTNITIGGIDGYIEVAPCHEVVSMFNWKNMHGINIDLVNLAADSLFYCLILMLIEMGVAVRYVPYGHLISGIVSHKYAQMIRQNNLM